MTSSGQIYPAEQASQARAEKARSTPERALDLSIIIVSYNTCELTLECLTSIYRETSGIDFEVLVVDNASADDSVAAIRAQYPQVELLAMEENLGFGRACNLAAQRARGTHILLLNPDARILDGAAQRLLQFAREEGAGSIVGGRAFDEDGNLEPRSCAGRPTLWSAFCRGIGLSALFPGRRLFDPESLGRWQRDSIRDVDIIVGCFLMVPRALWERLEGFDERFWMYGEDFDLCLRAGALGVRRILFPQARIVHVGGASERVRADKMARLFRAQAQFFRKHWGTLAAAAGVRCIDLWCLTRLCGFALLSWRSSRFADSRRSWREVWRQRACWQRPSA